MITQDQLKQWEDVVAAKIKNNSKEGTGERSEIKKTILKNLKMIFDREDEKAYICYFNELKVDPSKNIAMKMEIHKNFILVEQFSVVETEIGSKEKSYGSTIYSKYTGINIKDVDQGKSTITLLYGKDEIPLPIVLESKDTKKLTELICKLEST